MKEVDILKEEIKLLTNALISIGGVEKAIEIQQHVEHLRREHRQKKLAAGELIDEDF
jgi:hypothetical protein